MLFIFYEVPMLSKNVHNNIVLREGNYFYVL